jgi:hypothetical protein
MELSLLQMLAGLHPAVPVAFAVLGILVVAGQAVVIMTPSVKDDEAWEKIKAIKVLGPMIAGLATFAPIQKK